MEGAYNSERNPDPAAGVHSATPCALLGTSARILDKATNPMKALPKPKSSRRSRDETPPLTADKVTGNDAAGMANEQVRAALEKLRAGATELSLSGAIRRPPSRAAPIRAATSAVASRRRPLPPAPPSAVPTRRPQSVRSEQHRR